MATVQHSLPGTFLDALTRRVGAPGVLTDPADCWAYGYDNSRRHALPQAVVFATAHEQVRDVVHLCNTHGIALIARGRGTGTTGATVPISGGLVLSLERMDRIVAVDPENRVLIAEPGATNQAVQEAAAAHGFFWPPDPTSAAYCTLGGNLAYNSAGPRAVKYGTPRENTLGLRAVTGAGEEIRTGVYTTKGVVGYDLTRLLIGSEGTLAIITEATLKLMPVPEARTTLQAVYGDVRAAATAVSRIMAQPVTPCAVEFMDAGAIEMIRAHSQANLPHGAGALLIIEVDGPRACLQSAAEAVRNAAAVPGLLRFDDPKDPEEVRRLWDTRKALSPALRTIAPKKINEDVAVPVSHIAHLIEGLERLSQELAITIVNFGHAGNGNIHVNLLVDPDDPVQMENARRCLDRVFDLVLALGGTLSGEHGIGLEKRDYIAREIDATTLALMRRIKTQFDPKGLLNPGKMFPDPSLDPRRGPGSAVRPRARRPQAKPTSRAPGMRRRTARESSPHTPWRWRWEIQSRLSGTFSSTNTTTSENATHTSCTSRMVCCTSGGGWLRSLGMIIMKSASARSCSSLTGTRLRSGSPPPVTPKANSGSVICRSPQHYPSGWRGIRGPATHARYGRRR